MGILKRGAPIEDENILELFCQRKEQALLETQARYGRLCRRVADNILSDARDAEECVNDTWLQAWRSIPPERPARFSAWLARVTRNLAISRLRERGAQKRGRDEIAALLDELSECLPGGEEPERALEGRELAAAVDRFLGTLRKEEREVFVARVFFAAPSAELARRTGSSEAKISSQLQRTRKKLKQYLTEEGLW